MAFNPNELEPQFNEQRFWRKLRANLRRAGKDVIRHCLCLYYAAQKPETPLWAKTVVYGALAYFIIPLDAEPENSPLRAAIERAFIEKTDYLIQVELCTSSHSG